MLDAGVGETHVNNLLACLDIPPMCHKTFKKCERRVGVVLEKQAKSSCGSTLLEEANRMMSKTSPQPTTTPTKPDAPAIQLSPSTLTKYRRRLQEGFDVPDAQYDAWKCSMVSSGSTTVTVVPEPVPLANDVPPLNTVSEPAVDSNNGPDSTVALRVSFDCGWAKRGRAMNSLTGVGVNIGTETGKVVGYATRNKRCITCDVAQRLGRPPRKHDCRRNHTGK